MRSFSIIPTTEVDVVDQYTDFLSRELNNDLWFVGEDDVCNPLLMQQMAVMRATRIQKAVETNGAVFYQGMRYTNDVISCASAEVARKISEVAPMITTSLDRGFIAMHQSLLSLNEGVMQTNERLSNVYTSIDNLNEKVGQSNHHLRHLPFATIRGMSALQQAQQVANQQLQTINKSMNETTHRLSVINRSIGVLSGMIGQWFSVLYHRLNASHAVLLNVLEELRIPESQRERRYHIEEGVKFLAMALAENDKYYYEDAISEFEHVIKLEHKDIYSWYNLGFIYLRSVDHIDIKKAVAALGRFVHYARAEAVQRDNQSLKLKIDDAYLMLAEAHYLLNEPKDAINWTDKCSYNIEKARFMKVKYLSFIASAEAKKDAADILCDLLMHNPFLSLQVLEDADMIRNEYISDMLKKLAADVRREAKSRLKECRDQLKSIPDTALVNTFKNKINQAEKLIERNTLLESYEALYLLCFNFQKTINGFNIEYNINGVTFDMVFVEGGTYMMGATPEQKCGMQLSHKPAHQVTVSDFLLCDSVVTQELWCSVMGYNPSREQNPQFPVTWVSWEECRTFIAKLNQLIGGQFRLPTEAEWEYAARGGRVSKGFRFAGSNDYNKVAWVSENALLTLHCVKQKLPNELGLYDMCGNVDEWCQDWFGYYDASSKTNPLGPVIGKDKVHRGGNCYSQPEHCIVSSRGYTSPELEMPGLGFRLAL